MLCTKDTFRNFNDYSKFVMSNMQCEKCVYRYNEAKLHLHHLGMFQDKKDSHGCHLVIVKLN